MTFLAWKDGALSSTRIARSVGTNPVVVRRLLRQLAEAGLIRSKRGPLGGSTVARPANEISLLEIRDASGDPGLMARHPLNRHCPFGRAIRPGLDALVEDVEANVRIDLAGRTLADALRLMKQLSTSDML